MRRKGVALDKALLIQLVGSAMAVALLVGLAAWARIARPTPPLDASIARALLAEEFPDDPVDAVWIAADGAGLVARSGQTALVLWRKGDGYVARDAPWTHVLATRVEGGRLRLALADDKPRLRVSGEVWPPAEFASSEWAA
jgi:hypothetical protein